MIVKDRFNLQLVCLALFGVILSLILQEYNSSLITSSEDLRYEMIYTADEPSYIQPVRNWLDNGVWADNFEGNSKYFQRPPGYGLLFGVCALLLGEHAYLGLKLLHVFAFFCTIYLIGRILRRIIRNDTIVLASTAIFAALPIFHGFMYYPLTEGITPFLLVFFVYRITFDKNKVDLSLLLVTAFLLLMRPQLIVLPLLFFGYAILKNKKHIAFSLILAAVPILIWSVRTVSIEGEWKGLHPIYSNTNVTLFRPSHEKLTELFRIWEYDGERFHTLVGSLKNVSNEKEMDVVLDVVPEELRNDIKPLLEEYKSLLEHPGYGSSLAFFKQEDRFIGNTEKTKKKIANDNRVLNHVVTPFRSAVYLLSKSQLNLFVFQSTWRGNWLMEGLRITAILLINFGFIAAFSLLFRKKIDVLSVIAVSVLFYFFYLIYYQRMNEERYLTPWLPILYLLLVVQLNGLRNWIASKRQSLQ